MNQFDTAAGYLELAHARVRWFLSVNDDYIPEAAKSEGQRTYRAITVEGEALEFSQGFADLHTLSYRDILSGGGFGLEAAQSSIETVHNIRVAKPEGLVGAYHPFAKKVRSKS